MSSDPILFKRVSIAPFECLAEGWNRIRDQYWLFAGICAAGVLLASFVPMGILMGPMFCGIYYCCLEKWRDRNVSFDLLFKGFDSGIFLQSLIATLILMAVGMLIVLPLIVAAFASGLFMALANSSRHGSSMPGVLVAGLIVGAFVVWMLVSTLLGTLVIFAYPLIVDKRLSGTEALRLSVRAALANFWGLVGLTLTTTCLGVIGMLCCYVGAFLVMPVSFGALSAAYVKVFGLSGPEPQPLPSLPQP